MNILEQLKNELGIRMEQAEAAVKLIDEGNTIPFIARYRKEATGALNDEVLRNLYERLQYLRNLEEKQTQVLATIEEQGTLTEELRNQILATSTLVELEDLYRPYRPKRRTRATIAKEKGLEPFAKMILDQELTMPLSQAAESFITGEKVEEEYRVSTTQEAIEGAMDIIAEEISDNADFRKFIRIYTMRNGTISSKSTNKEETEKKRDVYQMYHEFTEPLKAIARHRILALNRGEAEEFLSVKIEVEPDGIINHLVSQLVAEKRSITSEYMELATADAYKRLIMPSIENELRNQLTDNAQEGAMKIFSENLKNLLLQAPIKNKVVLGYDPGYRTGCKLAVVDGTGRVLDVGVIYPTPPTTPQKIEDAKKKVSSVKIDGDNYVGNGLCAVPLFCFLIRYLSN